MPTYTDNNSDNTALKNNQFFVSKFFDVYVLFLIFLSKEINSAEVICSILGESSPFQTVNPNYEDALGCLGLDRKIYCPQKIHKNTFCESNDPNNDEDLALSDDIDFLEAILDKNSLWFNYVDIELNSGITLNLETLVSEEFFGEVQTLPWIETLTVLGAIMVNQIISNSRDSDTSKNLLNEPMVNATDLIDLDLGKSDIVDASRILTITGSASDILFVVQSSGITTSSTYNATVSNTTVAAADLSLIDADTSGTVDATAATTITGTAAELVTAIQSSGITTSSTYNATTSSGTTTVAQANTMDGDTTGIVTATISDGDLSTLGGLTGTGNAYTITVTDTTVAQLT